MTVAELVAELAKYPPSARVLGTWEGICRELSVYADTEGTVIVDSDENFYRDDFISGQITALERAE